LSRITYYQAPQTWESDFLASNLTLSGARDIDYNTAELYTVGGYTFVLDYYTTWSDYVITSIGYESRNGRLLAELDQVSWTLTEFLSGGATVSDRELVGTSSDDVFRQNGVSAPYVAAFNGTGGFEIDGRGGTDTIDYGSLGYFQSMIRPGRVELSGDTLIITQLDGDRDEIVNVEYFAFRDGTLTREQILERAGLAAAEPAIDVPEQFSESHYLQMAGLSGLSRAEAYLHFRDTGWRLGLDPNDSFDTSDYLAAYQDIAQAGINPFEHYLAFGAAEGRLADPGGDAMLIARYGQTIVQAFDRDYYLARNPDVAAAGIDPIIHFMEFGWREGRDPTAAFDTTRYLAVYRDVAAADANPFEHYLLWGQSEGRDTWFSSDLW